MRIITATFLSFFAMFLVGCKSTCCDGESPQSIVEATKADHANCTRLTLHCVQDDGSMKVCASTAKERLNTASDPEDVRSMTSGDVIILDEGTAIDVTIPIVQTDGKWTTVCGVTLERADADRDQVVANAKAIAATVKARLGTCCPNGTCCSK